MTTTLLIAALLAFAAALLLVRALSGGKLRHAVVDVPNSRSLHITPTPRTGGIGLMLGAALAWLLMAGGALAPLAAIAALLAAVFLIDDVRGLPVPIRLTVQLAAAAAFVWWLAPGPLWLAPLIVVGIVWSANLYNFMDGSNGLAGGMTAIGFAGYAIAARLGGAPDVALGSAIIAGAATGFLYWNFDPARIFLGDAGSIPLGFLAATLGIIGWQRGVWAFWLPLLVFAPFWIDASLTLFRRWRRGEKLAEAHRSHYYQRLIQSGWSHGKLALAEYAVMSAAVATAILLRNAPPLAVVATLAMWAVTFAWIAILVDQRWAKHMRNLEP